MIFEQESLPFQILDVFYLDQGNVSSTFNAKRNFDALSFRIDSDAVIESKNRQMELLTNHIGYFPSDVNYTRRAGIDKLIVVHFKSFGYHSDNVEGFAPENPGKYAILFRRILDCWNAKMPAYKHEASAILSEIFAEMYRDNRPSSDTRSKIAPSLQYINENMFKKDFSLKTAAGKSLMSDTYFRKLFKRENGISPKQYVVKARINHASSLLITGYFSVGEVADMCGYDDSKHFSTEFKKLTGFSPSKYTYNYRQYL